MFLGKLKITFHLFSQNLNKDFNKNKKKVKAVKYLFKYIYKGPDKAQAFLTNEKNCVEEVIDEIKEYIEARYISAIEGVWQFSFVMHAQDPPVIRLETHLEDKNTIIFKDSQKLAEIKNKNQMTKLTAYFFLNIVDENARNYLYHEIPKHYIWKSTERKWQRRKYGKTSNMLGRMYFINPNEMERYNELIYLKTVLFLINFYLNS